MGVSIILNLFIFGFYLIYKKTKPFVYITLFSTVISSFFPCVTLILLRRFADSTLYFGKVISILYILSITIIIWSVCLKSLEIVRYCALSTLVVLFLEIFVFNFDAISYNKNLQTKHLSLKNVVLNNSIKMLPDESIVVSKDGGYIEFYDLNIKSQNIYIVTDGITNYSSGSIFLMDDNNAYSYQNVYNFNYNPGSKNNYNILCAKAYSNGKLKALKIQFEATSGKLKIKDIYINKPINIRFNLVRIFLLLFLIISIILIIKYKVYEMELDDKKFSHRCFFIGTMSLCLFVSLLVFNCVSTDSNTNFIKYPLESQINSYQPYIQQFDAFKKGQFNIDVEPDERLNKLNNVYDISERIYKNANYMWDRAYYSGKYYSYFGIAPIIIIYYPVYFLLGVLPYDLMVSTILSCIGIIFIFGAIKELAKTFCEKINLLMLAIVSVAAIFGSFIFMVQSSTDFYYIAVESMIAFFSMFIYFSFKAYNLKILWKKIVCFFMAGISFILLILSRPNEALVAVAFVAPIFLSILFNKNKKLKLKVYYSMAFFIPITIGAMFIINYNYSRFGSFTQFGAVYQLTVNDVSTNHLRLDNFFKAIYSYFIQFPNSSAQFPWISLSDNDICTTGKYLYHVVNIGVLTIPVNLAPILFYNLIPKQNKSKNITYILVYLSILFLAFIDFNLGGSFIRYTCDIALAIGFISALTLLEINQYSYEMSIQSKAIYKISILICLMTIFIGTMLIFTNERNYIMNLNPDNFLFAKELFQL